MQILQECKRFLSYGGLGTDQYVDIGEKQIPRTIPRAIIITGLMFLCILHFMSFFNHFGLGVEALLYPLHCIVLNDLKLLVYFVMLWKTPQIAQLIDCVETLVKRRCDLSAEARAIYTKRHSYERKLVLGIAVSLASTFGFSYTPPALCWMSTLIFGVPSEEFWSTPVGTAEAVTQVSFGIAVFAEWVLVELFLVISIEYLIFYVCVCTYIRPIVDDLATIIAQPSKAIEQRVLIKGKLTLFIQLHEKLYEMLEEFERAVSVAMFLQVPVFALVLAILLYQMENNLTHFSLDIAFNVIEMLYYAAENFVLCYFVSRLITETGSIGDIAYDSPWYQMPLSERVCVEMIIRRAQRPFELKGMGVFVCSLETYLKLTRSAISYYMIFRRLNAT